MDLKPCEICQKPGDLDFLGRCEPCFRRYINNLPPESLYPPGKRCYTEGEKGSISAAHTDDIKRRMVGPDGQVYRDRKRSSIVVK